MKKKDPGQQFSILFIGNLDVQFVRVEIRIFYIQLLQKVFSKRQKRVRKKVMKSFPHSIWAKAEGQEDGARNQ